MFSEGHQVKRQDVSLLKSTLLLLVFPKENLYQQIGYLSCFIFKGKHLEYFRTLKAY